MMNLKKIELIDEPLTNNAYGMHFDSMGGIENTVEFMAYGSDDLKFEASNIGYTSYGVVLKFVDVDFQNGQFTRIFGRSFFRPGIFGKQYVRFLYRLGS